MRLTLLPTGRPAPASSAFGAAVSVVCHLGAIVAILASPTIAEHIASFEEALPQGLTFLVPRSTSPEAPTAPTRFQQASTGGSAGTGAVQGDRTTGYEVIRGGDVSSDAITALESTTERDATAGNPAEEYGEYFTLIDVDSAAIRHAESAAPIYPAALMRRGIEGFAALRFIVDSTGFVDMATVEVIDASRPEFVRAVREALPKMRFRPAIMAGNPVRQLAEQMFRFKVQRPPLSALPTGLAVKPAGRPRD